jgi:hypothetical protein
MLSHGRRIIYYAVGRSLERKGGNAIAIPNEFVTYPTKGLFALSRAFDRHSRCGENIVPRSQNNPLFDWL